MTAVALSEFRPSRFVHRSKRWRARTDDVGPGARRKCPADRMVQQLLAPGRARYSRSDRAIGCRHRRYRLGSAPSLLGEHLIVEEQAGDASTLAEIARAMMRAVAGKGFC
jgi:hypothetical protein